MSQKRQQREEGSSFERPRKSKSFKRFDLYFIVATKIMSFDFSPAVIVNMLVSLA